MDCVEFLVVPGLLWFAGLFLRAFAVGNAIFFDVTTWIKRGGLRGSCGHFDGGFGTWLLNGR